MNSVRHTHDLIQLLHPVKASPYLFTGEEHEAQRSEVTCPKPPRTPWSKNSDIFPALHGDRDLFWSGWQGRKKVDVLPFVGCDRTSFLKPSERQSVRKSSYVYCEDEIIDELKSPLFINC